VQTNGTGSATPWRPCTLAMAARLTDRVWTLREVLCSRVPLSPPAAGGVSGGECGAPDDERITCAPQLNLL